MSHFDEHVPLIGAHCSISGGLSNALKQAVSLGANCLQIFTANQKRWHRFPLNHDSVCAWNDLRQSLNISFIASHASYLINLGSDKPHVVSESVRSFKEEIYRCQQLNINVLNFHPGSHCSITPEQSISQIIAHMNECADMFSNTNLPILCLETTAGQGTQIGTTFEELGYIIDRTKHNVPVGICIDTCHIFASGYDLNQTDSITFLLSSMQKSIDIDKLVLIHLNDSKGGFGSKKDRHESLGFGQISIDAFKQIMQNRQLVNVAKVLETPQTHLTWEQEIHLLKQFSHT